MGLFQGVPEHKSDVGPVGEQAEGKGFGVFVEDELVGREKGFDGEGVVVLVFGAGYGVLVCSHQFVVEVQVLDRVDRELKQGHVQKADQLEDLLGPVQQLVGSIDGGRYQDDEGGDCVAGLKGVVVLEGVVNEYFCHGYPDEEDVCNQGEDVEDVLVVFG